VNAVSQTIVQTLAIASGKGGVGKSFLALNLAWCLSELGQSVLLVELDAEAGGLTVAAGLGEPKVLSPAADPVTMASRATPLPGNARVHLLRASDIPSKAAHAPGILEPLLSRILVHWRIIDLAPGIGAQNILWLRRADPSLLIGTPELVSVRAMLRLHMQLHRQSAYDWLCSQEPRLREIPPSLANARQRLTEFLGAETTERLWQEAFRHFQPSRWIFNRVLPDDEAQMARITAHLHRQPGAETAQPHLIPEDSAQTRCSRYGRTLVAYETESNAARAIRTLAESLLHDVRGATHTVRVVQSMTPAEYRA
jgi:MinD-like ATPase involved in chromosome partitioning or flagellar assembly